MAVFNNLNKNEKKYLVKHDTSKFKKNTIVIFVTCTYSGKCYLCSDPNNELNREWIMCYSLQKIN